MVMIMMIFEGRGRARRVGTLFQLHPPVSDRVRSRSLDGRGAAVQCPLPTLPAAEVAKLLHLDFHALGCFPLVFAFLGLSSLSLSLSLRSPSDDRTPGPVTGGAELTGSQGMLPLGQKRPTRQAETHASVTLRRPLVLSWRVSPVAAATGTDDIVSGVDGVDSVDGVDEGGTRGRQEIPGEESGGRDEEGREGRGKKKQGDAMPLGNPSGGGARTSNKAGTATRALRLRTPAWGRLIFADRKR